MKFSVRFVCAVLVRWWWSKEGEAMLCYIMNSEAVLHCQSLSQSLRSPKERSCCVVTCSASGAVLTFINTGRSRSFLLRVSWKQGRHGRWWLTEVAC